MHSIGFCDLSAYDATRILSASPESAAEEYRKLCDMCEKLNTIIENSKDSIFVTDGEGGHNQGQ